MTHHGSIKNNTKEATTQAKLKVLVRRCMVVDRETACNLFLFMKCCDLLVYFGCLWNSFWSTWIDFGYLLGAFGPPWAPRGFPWCNFGIQLVPLGLRGAIWGTLDPQDGLVMTSGPKWTSKYAHVHVHSK